MPVVGGGARVSGRCADSLDQSPAGALEVVLAEAESADSGEIIAADLLRALEVSAGDLVAGAYIDLLGS